MDRQVIDQNAVFDTGDRDPNLSSILPVGVKYYSILPVGVLGQRSTNVSSAYLKYESVMI